MNQVCQSPSNAHTKRSWLDLLTKGAPLLFLLSFLFSLSSCYIAPGPLYRGRDTLPEQSKEPSNSALNIPRIYQIRTLPAPDLTLRDEIAAAITYYMEKDPRYIPLAFERRANFDATLKQIFRDEGVPIELLSLALVESGYRNDIRSHAGALGMWQFMKPTAKSYGLKIGLLEDQRKDPILSTIAAARMLRDLYDAYEDWPLALAAYNSGPARVDRALLRTGARTYWELCKLKALPPQTRKFVPKIFAAAIIEKYPRRYGFRPIREYA